MRIEHDGDGAKITINQDEANEWSQDEYNIPTSDITEELQEMGFGKVWYEIEGSVDITLHFTVKVKAGSEEDASDLVLDNVDIDEGSVADAFDCSMYDAECEEGEVNAEVSPVDIKSVDTSSGY